MMVTLCSLTSVLIFLSASCTGQLLFPAPYEHLNLLLLKPTNSGNLRSVVSHGSDDIVPYRTPDHHGRQMQNPWGVSKYMKVSPEDKFRVLAELAEGSEQAPVLSHTSPGPGHGDNLFRMKLLERQKLLNLQYQLQYQIRQLAELKSLRMELLEAKKLLQRQKERTEAQIEPAASHWAPSQLQLPPSQNLDNHANAEEIEPAAPVVVCDEREQVGRTKVLEIRTVPGIICKVKIETFDKCPGTDPVNIVVDSIDPKHPDACKGVENIFRTTKLLTNTLSRLPGKLLGVTQYAVNAYDAVKGFYANLIQQHRSQTLHEGNGKD